MEVPIRASLRKSTVLALVGTLLELEDAVGVIAALHHGAHWFVPYVLPPVVYGFLYPVELLGVHPLDVGNDFVYVHAHTIQCSPLLVNTAFVLDNSAHSLWIKIDFSPT